MVEIYAMVIFIFLISPPVWLIIVLADCISVVCHEKIDILSANVSSLSFRDSSISIGYKIVI